MRGPTIIPLSALLVVAAVACDSKSTSKRDDISSEPEASSALDRAFDTEGFAPIPKPAAGDWLAEHPEPGQTFSQFTKQRPNVPTDERRTIYFLPVGPASKHSASLDTLREYAAAYYTLPVKVLARVTTEDIGATSRINGNTNAQQLLTTDILTTLQQRIPDDAYALIALTDIDLYPEESWNFVFGQASFRERVGVYSFARYHPSFYGESESDPTAAAKLVLLRAMKVMVHELGHMFGIYHCTFHACVMNGSNHLEESDRSPLHLCPIEVRKLHHTVGFDPVSRYRALASFYDAHGFSDEAVWVRERLARIAAAP
jgi:archaemetzincin